MIREFLQARRARYKAAALREQAECARQQRLVTLYSKGYLTPSEHMEVHRLQAGEPIPYALPVRKGAIMPVMEAETRYAGPLDALSPWNDLNDQMMDFARGGIGAGGITGVNRRSGADFPFFKSEQELAILRDSSRLLVRMDPNAEGLLGGLRRYTFGRGLTVRIVPKGDAHAALAKHCQAIVDEFCRENRFQFRQREFFTRAHRDGEGVMRIFPQDDGTTKLRFVWPEQIRQPVGTTGEEWGFGRQTDPEDVETTTAWAIYPIMGDHLSEPDIVPASEIVYFGPNADSGVRRSVPDFVFGTGEALNASNKLAVNMGEGSAQQAAIAYIRQHEGVPTEAIRSFVNEEASYSKPSIYSNTDIQVKRALPGTIVDTNENTSFLASPYNMGIPSHLDVGKMLLRRAASRYNAPEWLASADASNNNFASSLTAESPFILSILELQEHYADIFRDLFERVLLHAMEHGAIGGVAENMLHAIEVKVSLPNPQTRDLLSEAQRHQVEIASGTNSPQTACDESGREWAKIKKEREELGMPLAPEGASSAIEKPQANATGAEVPRVRPPDQ